MPMEPHNQFQRKETEEEYRMRQAARAKRQKKRRTQRIVVMAAFGVAAILLVVCIVLIFRSIFGGGKKDDSSLPESLSTSVVSVPPVSTPAVPVADPTEWNLILINPTHPMADGFKPATEIVSPLGHEFDSRAAADLKAMVEACNAEGHSLAITSAYRGPQTQNGKYNDLVAAFKAQGKSDAEAEMMALEIDPPYGQSDHQTGLAVDFITGTVQEATQAFADTNEYKWLTEHAAEHGFVLRFPADKAGVTGITYQPYHFRYVGKEAAAAMNASGQCLEEYLRQTAAPPAASDAGVTSGAGDTGDTSASA